MSDLENELRSYLEDGGTQKCINELVKNILSEQPKLKVVINTCFGGFGLSSFACKNLDIESVYEDEVSRTDPRLVSLIERYGSEKISGDYAQLEICECPVGSDWSIDEHDGNETLYW